MVFTVAFQKMGNFKIIQTDRTETILWKWTEMNAHFMLWILRVYSNNNILLPIVVVLDFTAVFKWLTEVLRLAGLQYVQYRPSDTFAERDFATSTDTFLLLASSLPVFSPLNRMQIV